MSTPELINYIQAQLQNGQSQEQIQQTLVSNGWQITDVQNAFAEIFASPVSNVGKNKKIKWIVISIVSFIIILIIGVIMLLSFFVNTGIKTTDKKSMTMKQVSEMKTIQNSVELYYGKNKKYPKNLSDISSAEIQTSTGALPKDSISKQPYYYELSSDGKNYKICPPDEPASKDCIKTNY